MSYICLSCVSDPYLQQNLVKHDAPCEYCDSDGPSAELFEVAQEFDRVLQAHFEPTHRELAVVIYGRRAEGLDLEDTIIKTSFVRESAVDDLAEMVKEIWFDPHTHTSRYSEEDEYAEPSFRFRSDLGWSMSASWRDMEASLKHEVRHFNPYVIGVLQEVFGQIHSLITTTGDSVIVNAGPGTKFTRLIRARTFSEPSELEKALGHPAKFLGTPPPGISASGRMNSAGQPAFYGATDEATALAEVRPAVGSLVATAAFDIVRPLQLLDLRSFSNVQISPATSLFDPDSIRQAVRRDFLASLSQQLLAPATPGYEDRGYLVTQVVSDYLATHSSGPLDGIIYPSVQNPAADDDSCNVALFHRASLVTGADEEPIGQGDLWEYEDESKYFSPHVNRFPVVQQQPLTGLHQPNPSTFRRLPSLTVVLEAIKVHEVKKMVPVVESSTVPYSPPPAFQPVHLGTVAAPRLTEPPPPPLMR